MHLKSLSRFIQLLLLTAFTFASHKEILRKMSKHTRRHLADNPPKTTGNSTNSTAAASKMPAGDLRCNPKVPQLFNMTGTGSLSSKVFLDVCGLSSQSCCTLTDQEKMVEIWNKQGTGFNLKDRMEFHKKLVREVYDEAINISKRANKMLAPTKKPSPECLLMARRIEALRIHDIFPRIMNNFGRMHDFFFTAYKGLHCAACDPATNSQFNVDKKEVTLAPKFCRDLVLNSLNASLYNHKHTPLIAKLLVTFLDTCDSEGTFKQPRTAKNNPLAQTSKYEAELDKCKKTRNTPFWLENCLSYCQQFKVGQYDAVFEPEIENYSNLARTLKEMAIAYDAKTNNSTAAPSANNKNQTGTATKSNPSTNQNTISSPSNNQSGLKPGVTETQQPKPSTRKLRRRPRILEVQTDNGQPSSSSQSKPNNQPSSSSQTRANMPTNEQPGSDQSGFERYLKRSIFPSEGSNPHPIEQFNTKIKVRGIDLYKYGSFADLDTAKVQSSQSVQKVNQGVKNRANARKLKSVEVWKTIGSMLALFLILF